MHVNQDLHEDVQNGKYHVCEDIKHGEYVLLTASAATRKILSRADESKNAIEEVESMEELYNLLQDIVSKKLMICSSTISLEMMVPGLVKITHYLANLFYLIRA